MLVRAPRCGSGVSSGASEASPVAVATCPATALAARRARRAWVLGTCAGKEEGPRSELGVAWALEGAMVRRGLAPRPHGGRACPASACSVSSRCSRRPAAAAPAAASPTSCSAPPSAPPPSASILAGTLGWELGLAQPNWGNLCGPLDLVQQQRPAPSPTVVGNVLPLGITTQTPPFTRGPSCVVPMCRSGGKRLRRVQHRWPLYHASHIPPCKAARLAGRQAPSRILLWHGPGNNRGRSRRKGARGHASNQRWWCGGESGKEGQAL